MHVVYRHWEIEPPHSLAYTWVSKLAAVESER